MSAKEIIDSIRVTVEEIKDRRKKNYTRWNRSEKGLAASEKYREDNRDERKAGGILYEANRIRLKESKKSATNSRQKYTNEDDLLILNSEYSDSIIASRIGRSIKAIERRRAALKGKS